jgi:hypothetical protein
MLFWIGLVVLGFVVVVLIVESRPVRRRLEQRSGGDRGAAQPWFWTGGGDGGSWGGDGGGGGGDGGGGGC